MAPPQSLYVHIPFCRSKCGYCDFFSLGGCLSVPEAYTDALLKEISFYKQLYKTEGFRTVYIGGGTPSLLSPAQLSALLAEACPESGLCEELTIEMNPESLSEGLLAVFASCPARRRRLSLGIQSLSNAALASVGRRCGADTARQALALVHRFWRGELCLDLIAGLPQQSEAEFAQSIADCLASRPQHLSLYSLSVEEGTPLASRIGGLGWDSDEADGQWIAGRKQLEEAGYRQYEVSNFCLPGHESRHNMGYWRQEDYIGVGSGATGSVYGFSGPKAEGLRWTNTQDIGRYCTFWQSEAPSKGLPPFSALPRETERLPLATEEEEFLMLGLRSSYGVCSGEYRRRFSALEPWRGNLEARLGVHGGAWERFSAREELGRGCRIRRDGAEQVYSFEGTALSFLNSFLRHLT